MKVICETIAEKSEVISTNECCNGSVIHREL